jgi:predicted nucleic acid-binding protein
VTTSIDTNVLIALWDVDDALNRAAQAALDQAAAQGSLVVCAAVFAELLAFPKRTEAFLQAFFRDTSIAVDWSLSEGVWKAAGRAFGVYAVRRRRGGESGPRRLLADFVIGAHAAQSGYRLLTLDQGIYRTAFPKLKLISL